MNITSKGKCNARLLHVERSCVGKPSSHASLIAVLTLVFCLLLPARAQSSFTPGNVVIYRVGDGSGPLVNTGNPVFLDEFSPAGTLVQSIPMPYSTSFSTARPGAAIAYVRSALVASGSAVEEIGISRSADGRFLILTGYDTAIPCDRPLTATHAYDVGRVIARVDHSGGVNISTVLTDLPSNVTPYAAVSDNGSRFWLAGSGGKIHYVPFAAATTTEIAQGVSGLRNLTIANGRLYASRSGSISGISRVGSGLPTTVGQVLTPLAFAPEGLGKTNSFFFANLLGSPAGNPDTLYIADESVGLRKYSLTEGLWDLSGTIGSDADDYRGLTATVVEDTVTLYATRRASGSTGGGELVKIIDASGHGGAFGGFPNVLVTAAANTTFRGIALAPEPLPDLSVEVTAPASATLGTPFEYTFTVYNTGDTTATGITVRFAVPSGLVVEAGPDADGFIGPGAAEYEPVVEFIDGTLAPGATATLVLTVSAETTGTFTAAAQAVVVDPNNWIVEGYETNNGSPMAATTVVSSAGPEPTTFTWSSFVGGDWSDGTKWHNDKGDGSAPQFAGAANYELNFNNPNGYSYTNDLSADFALNRLNFGGFETRLLGERIEFTMNGTTGPQIRQNNGNVASIEAPIRFMNDLTFTGPGDGTVTLAAELSGTGGLIKRGPGILALTAANTYAGNTTIHSGTLSLTGPSGMKQLIAEGSFEKPPFGAEGWSYNTSFTGWEIHGPAGIASSYSPWVDVPPDGNQVAFLQDTQGEASSITQEVNVEISGQYRLSFQVANRPGYTANGLIFKVDGLPVASWSDVEIQSEGSFFELTFTTFLFAGSHVIEFLGSNTTDNGDVATLIDNISLVGPIGKLPGGTKVMLQTEGSTLDIGDTEQAFDSLAGVAGSTVINNGKLTLNPSGPPSSFDGTMTGSGTVVKAGPGIVSLNGVIAYSGDSIVEEGSLRFTSTNPNNDSSHVFINYGATLNLDFDGVETVGSFDIGESSMSPGYYNASNSGGAITGTGNLLVLGATPEIVVTHANEELARGTTVDFGIVVDGVPSDDIRVLVIRNTGSGDLEIDISGGGGGVSARPGAGGSSGGSVADVSSSLLSGPAAGDFHITDVGFDNDDPDTLRLYPGGIGYFVISFTPDAPGVRDATFTIPSNDPDEGEFTIELSGGSPQAPFFVTQPQGLEIDPDTGLVLDSEASGVPAPTYQWYEGDSGDDSNPIFSATSASFTTPVLNVEAHYWVRASNPSGTVDSDTAIVTIRPPSLAEIDVQKFNGETYDSLPSGSTMDFGSGTVAFTPYVNIEAIRVYNDGEATLESLQVTVTGPDAESFGVNLDGVASVYLPFPTLLDPGNTGHFSVTMVPTKEGQLTATLNIFSNDADENPFTLTLTGNGYNPTSTTAATGVTQTTATLNGIVNPYGVSTTVVFEYGTTTEYGSIANVTLSPDDGLEAQNVSAEISGLEPGTNYHYRLIATNSQSSTSGGDRTFTTPTDWTDFTYTISDDQVTITGYTGSGGAVVIPGIIEGFPVVAIGESAFFDNDTITSVVIPEGVYGIGLSAFLYCDSITSVTIPNTVTYIESQAFRGCTSITSIFIPESVHFISVFAFDLMSSLTGFTVDPNNASFSSLDGVLFNKDQTTLLVFPGGQTGPYITPASVTRIEDYAFYFCTKLSGVTLFEGMQYIGYGAFEQCDSLISIMIPSSVSLIQPGSMSDCDTLQSITVTEPNGDYTSQDGVLFNDDLTTLIQYPAGIAGNYLVPASVTSISGVAFINADGLTGITLPSGLTQIGLSAFYSCGSLASVDIPPGVTSIGHTTFAYCTSLTSVTFHEGLVSFGEYAFNGCTSLTSVCFPSTVTTIGNDAFRYCNSLESAVFMGEAPTSIDAEAFGSASASFFIGYFDTYAAGFAAHPWTEYLTVNLGDPAPEIRVDELLVTEVATEDSRDFGIGPVGENISTKTFVVSNRGYTPLENLDVTVDGSHADDFSLDLSGFPTSIACGASAQFTISFTPGAAEPRDAVLSIFSNDADENPFIVNLNGAGLAEPSMITLALSGDATAGILREWPNEADGYRFDTGAQALRVIWLGLYDAANNDVTGFTGDGLLASHRVSIWRESDGVLIAQTTVLTTDALRGNARGHYIPAVTLAANTGYVIAYDAGGGDRIREGNDFDGLELNGISHIAGRFNTAGSGMPQFPWAVMIGPNFGYTLDSGDTTPPTLAGSGIVDDQSGEPVAANTLVTYTVTFSEDMEASTVDATDFGNAGNAAITIGTVTETAPGVFSVPVTPTSGGTLQLQVITGVVLTDVAGNPLVTNPVIDDDTILTVDEPPAITTQPKSITIVGGSAAVLTVEASGYPEPDFQWYQGTSGDTSQPIGEGSATLITPPLAADSSFWVRVSNSTGSVDSDVANVKVATMTLAPGLVLNTYQNVWGVENLNPIANLTAVTPSGRALQIDDITYHNGFFLSPPLPGLTNAENFSMLWRGWLDVSVDGAGEYTFGTSSDDGSVIYIDLNNDGDFGDTGELVVDNNFLQVITARVGTAKLPAGLVAIAIGFFEQQGVEEIEARFKKRTGLAFEALDPINGTSGHFFHDSASLPLAPVIITQPASRAIANGTSAELFVEASAVPTPVYQWYQGESGNTLNPVDGATSANFTSPALVATRSYWVRVTNPQGSVDSATATITVDTPSATNAYLSNLRLSNAALFPAFDPLIGIYSANVNSSVSSIRVTQTLVGVGATMTVNGQLVSNGSPSSPVKLDPGINVITTVVTAGTGGATRTYTVTVTRAAPLLVTTEPAEMVDSTKALMKGTVTPYGAATVYFEYGTTPAFGELTEATVVSGDSATEFQQQLSGLPGGSTFYYRSVAVNEEGTFYGMERSFTTSPDAPVAATGDPAVVTNNSATLIGAVDPKGLETVVVFQYGTTNLYGNVTPPQIIPPGTGIVDIVVPNAGLIPNSTYHYRIVASNAAGDAIGDDVVFNASVGGGVTSTSPTAKPNVDTGAAVAIGTQSATLLGKVNPNQGTTLVQFEYGATESYGRKTKTLGVGNGSTFADVALPAEDIAPGTTMHYRLLASNSLGMSAGEDRTFTTKSPAPTAVTGEAEILTTTKARLNGWARGNGNSANVFFDYGTDGVTFPNSISAEPATVTGNINTAVYAELPDLSQGVTYYFRVRAEGVNGTGTGDVRSLKPALLSGLIQRFPDQVTPNERQGSVTVTLHPGGIGSGWRFAGELSWRLSGIPATGLTSGDRVIEYRPVAGHVQPTSETVSVVSAPPGILLDRSYTASATTGTGDLTVTLKPESLADSSVPVANRPQWRLFGENDAQWKDSGTTISGLVAGNHLIECKAVPSRATPPASSAMIEENQSTTSTITYFLNQETIGAAPGVLTFQVVSASADQPYAYCGQIRSDVGGGSGFVVGPRVVATAGHVVFDDGALATATGLQWLFQRDRDVHEPRVLLPRGYYLMTGYAAQRAADNSPGTSTPQSQNLDAASLYFSEDAGRGGYSGYLASDSTSNEFILSSAIKTLVGYPLDGIAEQDRDKMHATPRSAVRFSQAFARTYTTSDIRSAGGNSGGPLCVQYENSNFYPAAIYLGGTAQTVVRAIDSDVVELFGFAETSGRSGVGDAGGSLTTISRTPIATPALGALQVMIEPAAARNAGGGWRLRSQSSFRAGGYQENNLNPNIYSVEFATVAGYVPPSLHTVEIKGGELATFSFTYEKIILPPVINSPDSVTGVRGSTLAYQITALNSPDLFSLRGALPAGMSFEESNGLISGIPTEAGRFIVTAGANNSGGADSRMVTLTSLPDLNPQSLTIPYNQPMSYQIITSESGNGVVFAATNLPQGLSLNPVSGQVSGTPMVAGSFPIPISVTIRNATATSILTLHITGTPPVFTLQPVAARTIAYGGSTSLKVAAEGLPAPTFQWYQGESGVTDSPIPGATSAMFTTPSLTTPTKYWVRASSISGSADSSTSAISLLPSTNANLAGLLLSSGTLSPTFNAGIASYAANVGNAVLTIQITPLVEVGQSTVRINGGPTAPGAPSIPLALATGPNLISVEVTAGDGTTKKTYLITVTRLAPASITTGGTLNLTDISATIQGTVIPNGNATVFFQYGRTTNYGSTTPPQDVSGINPLVFQSVLKGLQGDTEYHFRSAVTTAAGTFFGEDAMFRTAVNSPLVATGDAVDVTRTDALLLGAVDTNNIATDVYFEYGPTTNYGFNTPHGTIPAGVGVVDISYPVTGVNASYHYRLVAINAAGMAFGDDVILGTGGGSKIDSSKPDAATGDSSDITTGSAILQGLVNAHNRTTMVSFEYGLTETYGSKTASRGVGNGNTGITVVQMADGLLPGTTYHYRVSAANSHGTTLGEDRTFTTAPLAPAALTGDAGALTATTARIHGTVKARGANTLVSFEYGTDGMNFPNRANADPANVTGDAEIPVSLEIANLDELVTYYYRIRASNSGGTTLGAIRTLRTGSLQGLVQDFTREVPINDRQGQLIVNILPTAIGGWRFIGDTSWRNSGEMVASLTTGEREIEFRPVAGYIQPQNELVGVVSGETTQVLERIYYDSAVPGTGALKVFLLPESITGTGVSLPSRAQWRIVGDTLWNDSGAERTGLTPGSYLVECKAVLGKNTPSPLNALVTQSATKTISISYFPASAPSLIPPTPIPFATVSTSENLPYGFVGQIRSGTGSYSGFVVKPRVVVTVAQAIFDDATLSATSGTQWLLQRDRGTYEPTPQAPRGYYLFSGYDAQRTIEASPGLLSLQSQDLNVAALYFAADAGRGGFSGFLASDAEPNEFLTSTSLKTLVGYPVNGVSTANQGRMHATTPATATMTLALGRTYRTSQIRGMGGMFGGPFCVQKDGGAFYPAGVFVGGTTQSLIRAIDGNMIDLFTRAEVSGNGGDNNTGGGITHSSFTSIGTASQPGALKINILPEAAISAGRWSISPETTLRTSGAQKGNLAPGTYVIKFNTVAGFQVPAQQRITISGGQLSTLTYTFESSTTPQESWRLTNFNSTANAGIAADDADPDGDGASNRDEYAAGTNPNYAADRFKVLTMTRTTSLFSVSVLGKKDRTYVLERTSNLKAGSWSAVKSIGPLASDQPITLSDAAPPVDQGFYQVRVTSP